MLYEVITTGRFKTFEDLPQDDWRRTNPRFAGGNFEKNLALVQRVTEIAKDRNNFV